MHRSHNRGRRGAVLLNIIYVLAAIVLAGIVGFLAMTSIRYRAADARAAELQARLWAESGIANAVNRLRHDPFWRADGTETWPALEKQFENGGYHVVLRPVVTPNHLTIESEGSSSHHKSLLRQEVILEIPALFTLIAAEEIRMSGDAIIDGPISTGRALTLSGDAHINGAAQIGDQFNGSSRNVTGAVYEHFPQDFLPSLDPAPYTMTGRLRTGGPISNLTLSDTTLAIAGSTELAGLNLTNGSLIVDGDLRVVGPCRIEAPPGRLAVIVTGNLIIEERGALSTQGSCYIARDFKCRGKGALEGTLIARTIDISSDFHARPQLEAVYAPIQGLPRNVRRGQYHEENP